MRRGYAPHGDAMKAVLFDLDGTLVTTRPAYR